MKQPFVSAEVKKAIKSLKNNKSPGIDNRTSEELNHSPDVIYQHIAELINIIA